jgi:cytochrome c oxidase subunit 4
MTRADVSPRAVLVTGAALLVLWAVSFAASYVLTGPTALAVAIGIAVVKAALVALFFMELVRARASVVMALLTACVLTVTLIGLMVADIATRDVPARFDPRQRGAADESRAREPTR